jgi:hypothetical protein
MRMNRGIRQQLLAAGLGVSLLQPAALGAVGSLLLGAAAGEVRAQTLNTEAIARIAQAITVRIEGATQGSGVLVKREGNRYTVLTAWHVVSGQRPGEELSIYTPDGKEHHVKVDQPIRQKRTSGECLAIDPVRGGCTFNTGATLQDVSVIHFYSSNNYSTASVMEYRTGGYCVTTNSSCDIYVAGFPSSVDRALAVTKGKLITYGEIDNNAGYSLVYSAPTRVGMSGGPVLNYNGYLMGIHARGEAKAGSLHNLRYSSSGEVNQGVALTCQIDIDSIAYAMPGTDYHGYKIKSCD